MRHQFKNQGLIKSFKLLNLYFVLYALIETQTKKKIDDLVGANLYTIEHSHIAFLHLHFQAVANKELGSLVIFPNWKTLAFYPLLSPGFLLHLQDSPSGEDLPG